jgi:anti-anti-sigma factor
MNLATEVFGDVVVVHAPDELNEDRAPAFEHFLGSLALARVIVDLDNSESIDSAGLEVLLDSQDGMRRRGGELKLVANNHVNRKILELTRLDQQLEVFDSVIDAVKSFAG